MNEIKKTVDHQKNKIRKHTVLRADEGEEMKENL